MHAGWTYGLFRLMHTSHINHLFAARLRSYRVQKSQLPRQVLAQILVPKDKRLWLQKLILCLLDEPS